MSGSAEITRQNIATFNAISPVGSEVMEEARGSYRGEGVTLASDEAKLADAAEEIGMSVAHRADKKALGQRTVRQGQAAYPEALARLREYLEELPDMPREAELVDLIEQLQSFQEMLAGSGKSGGKGGGSGVSKEDVLAALHAFDADVTHQFAGLEIARAQFEANGADPAFLALLDEARGAFETSAVARDVRAGFAAAGIASRAAETLETDPAAVRDVYRAMLRDTMHMGQLFDALGRFALLTKFEAAVETFMAAAGRDLGSTGPSTDPLFLHGLLTELGKLKKMQSALDGMADLVRLTERGLPAGQRGADTVALTSRMLNFAALAGAGPSDARRLLGSFGDQALGVQLAFGNGLRGLHGELPDDVMPSLPARLQQVTAIMGLLDEIVEAEERAFAGDQAEPGRRGTGR